MRALFLLLLLANILFFAWTRWVAPPPAPPGRATPSSPGPASIRLLREAPLAQELSTVVEGAGLSEVSGAGVECVSGGPFRDQAAAEAALAHLGSLGYASRLRASRDEVRVGQSVSVDNLATPEDAANALAALKAAGLKDVSRVADEGQGTRISLGVFGDPAQALAAVAAAREAGFAASVQDRMQTQDVYWLDVDRQANAGLPGPEAFQPAAGEPVSLELRPCPAPAGPAAAAAPPPPAPTEP